MASSRKRQRATDITIKVASGAPLDAESFILRSFSSCARELPSDTQEWDVSCLLLNSEPFSHATVKCWLQCAYSVVSSQDELDAEDTALINTAQGLHQVLEFAQAVGSSGGVLSAACRHLEGLKFSVQLPQQTLEVLLCPHRFYFFGIQSQLQLHYSDGVIISKVGDPSSSEQDKQVVKQQVAEQTGTLLRMAHVLRLQPLIKSLNEFIFRQTIMPSSPLYGVLQLVFTDAMLDAALGSSTLSKTAYINSVLTVPCTFKSEEALFKPEGGFEIDPDSGIVTTHARLLQSFAGKQKGDKVHLQLDLFREDRPHIRIHSGPQKVRMAAHLLLGNVVLSPESLAAAMSSAMG